MFCIVLNSLVFHEYEVEDAVKNGVYQVCQSEVENEKVGNSSHPLVSWKHISVLSRTEKNFWYINGIDCLELGYISLFFIVNK